MKNQKPKQIIAVLCLLSLCIGLAACGKSGSEPQSVSTADASTGTDGAESGGDAQSTDVDLSWGSATRCRGGNDSTFYVNFPFYEGKSGGCGSITGSQGINATAGAYKEWSEETHNIKLEDTKTVEDIPVVYTAHILEGLFEYTYDNTSIGVTRDPDLEQTWQVTSTETVQINNYETCKFEGVYTYNTRETAVEPSEERSCRAVGYATFLETTGIPVFVLAVDANVEQNKEFDDEHNLDTIALNMISTLREAP